MRKMRRCQDERGAVLVFVALAMVVLIGSTALAVDIGQLTNKNRDLQAVADVVALDVARAIDGSNVAVLSGPSGRVTLAVADSASRNGNFPVDLLTIELGSITGTDPFVMATQDAAIPNAVRVTANGTVDFSFAPGGRDTNRKATAVRQATELAGFSIGSFFADVDTGGNALLDTIFLDSFGTNATLLGYSGLVGSSVQLGALAAKAGFGSPTELLATEISARDLLLASADALPRDGTQTAAINILNAMAVGASTETNIQLGRFITIDQPGGAAAAESQIDILGLLTSSAFLIDGEHAISLSESELNILGLGNVVFELSVIEAAQTVFGPVGTFAETAQASLTITPTFDISTSKTIDTCDLLGDLLSLAVGNLLSCLLGSVNRVITLDIDAAAPIELSVADGRATLVDISCDTAPQTITLDPELAAVELLSTVDIAVSGTLLGNDLGNILSVQAQAGPGTHPDTGDEIFADPDDFGEPRRVGSGPLGLTGLTNLDVTNVSILETDIGPVVNSLAAPLLPLVNQALTELDEQLIGPLNQLLGLNVGGAGLTAIPDSLQCGGSAIRLAE